MTKAFDFADLVSKMKGHGMDMTEDMAKLVATSVLDWIDESVGLTSNKFDDFFGEADKAIRPWILKQIDKINGKVDEAQ